LCSILNTFNVGS